MGNDICKTMLERAGRLVPVLAIVVPGVLSLVLLAWGRDAIHFPYQALSV